jgi:hypothetical protein
MVQTSMQFTPVQVLQAARRAEAEGKMDYALQFYRHLVEQHGTTPEAQEAREGLFRIAEWRWGEARVARTREAGASGAPAAQPVPAPPTPPPSGQRVYNVANQPPSNPYDEQSPAALPQVVARQQGAEDLPPFQARFRLSKLVAHALSSIGWITLLSGVFAGLAGGGGFVGALSAVALLGLPLGVLVGAPAVVLGLVLIVAGQLAAAFFDSTNATLELVAIERGRTSF